MQFKLFNATTALKMQKKIKKSDLNQKI